MKYDIVLFERPVALSIEDVRCLIQLIDNGNNLAILPINIDAHYHESSAIGFITDDAANALDYDYKGLSDFVANILDDMTLEDTLAADSYVKDGNIYHVYEFNNLKIWLNR